MQAFLNGEQVELEVGTTVSDVVAHLVPHRGGCAVARNGEVVPRSTWEKVAIEVGDRLEVLGAVAGG